MPDLRNHVSFTPFGRGTAATDNLVATPYSTIRTLVNTTKLDYTNLAPDAGWPESRITFSLGATGHQHQYSRLSPSSISTRHFNSARVEPPDTPVGCGFIFTASPGMLLLFGVSKTSGMDSTTLTSKEVEIDFMRDGITNEAFMPGTFPMVMVAPGFSGHPTTASAVQLTVMSVNSTGCVVRADKAGTFPFGRTDGVVYVYWMAIGMAPGLVAAPAVGNLV